MNTRWRPCREAEPDHGWRAAVFLALLFGITGLITRVFCTDMSGYTSFWPANAAMLVALLTLRARLAVPVLVCCFCVNLALNGLSHLPAGESVLACVLNVLQAFLAACLARRFLGAQTDLNRLRRLAAFALVAAGASAIEATIGILFEAIALGDDASVVSDWLQWVLCDTLGLLLATPVIILATRRFGSRSARVGKVAEPLALLLLTVALTVVSFLAPRLFLFLFIFPAMVILAFRCTPGWVLATVLIVSIVVSALTAHGMGPVAYLSPDGRLMRENMLQPYLLALVLCALPANSVIGENRRAARRLAQMRIALERAATHDLLTSLMNRQLLTRRLATWIRGGRGGTVLFIDLDHFKQVNDTLGHHAGDEVLRAFSDRMAELARDHGGEVGRFGGDEFAMLVPGRAAGDQPVFCATLLDVVRRPYEVFGQSLSMSVSIGVVVFGTGSETIDEIMRQADIALYAAKAAGRDGYKVFGRHVGEEAVAGQ